jgi:hypothetical protein
LVYPGLYPRQKLEYALYEVFSANDANKEKLRKIKEIMD